ncbi:hypothetical protein HU767_28410 [Pseudomonas sp. SWRI179]|nr:hypothetical protein [Pseudomonas sp. SWRI179]
MNAEFVNSLAKTVGASLLAKAAVHPTSLFQTDRYREQARSHRDLGVNTEFVNTPIKTVGASLLAMAAIQTTSLDQATRVLEQSRLNPTGKLFMTTGKAGIMAHLRQCGVSQLPVCP